MTESSEQKTENRRQVAIAYNKEETENRQDRTKKQYIPYYIILALVLVVTIIRLIYSYQLLAASYSSSSIRVSVSGISLVVILLATRKDICKIKNSENKSKKSRYILKN